MALEHFAYPTLHLALCSQVEALRGWRVVAVSGRNRGGARPEQGLWDDVLELEPLGDAPGPAVKVVCQAFAPDCLPDLFIGRAGQCPSAELLQRLGPALDAWSLEDPESLSRILEATRPAAAPVPSWNLRQQASSVDTSDDLVSISDDPRPVAAKATPCPSGGAPEPRRRARARDEGRGDDPRPVTAEAKACPSGGGTEIRRRVRGRDEERGAPCAAPSGERAAFSATDSVAANAAASQTATQPPAHRRKKEEAPPALAEANANPVGHVVGGSVTRAQERAFVRPATGIQNAPARAPSFRSALPRSRTPRLTDEESIESTEVGTQSSARSVVLTETGAGGVARGESRRSPARR